MPQQQGPAFVTVAEVADLMRVSKMTVYRMIHAGDIPAVRVGKSFRVPQVAVQQLIEGELRNFNAQGAAGSIGSVANS